MSNDDRNAILEEAAMVCANLGVDSAWDRHHYNLCARRIRDLQIKVAPKVAMQPQSSGKPHLPSEAAPDADYAFALSVIDGHIEALRTFVFDADSNGNEDVSIYRAQLSAVQRVREGILHPYETLRAAETVPVQSISTEQARAGMDNQGNRRDDGPGERR